MLITHFTETSAERVKLSLCHRLRGRAKFIELYGRLQHENDIVPSRSKNGNSKKPSVKMSSGLTP